MTMSPSPIYDHNTLKTPAYNNILGRILKYERVGNWYITVYSIDILEYKGLTFKSIED